MAFFITICITIAISLTSESAKIPCNHQNCPNGDIPGASPLTDFIPATVDGCAAACRNVPGTLRSFINLSMTTEHVHTETFQCRHANMRHFFLVAGCVGWVYGGPENCPSVKKPVCFLKVRCECIWK